MTDLSPKPQPQPPEQNESSEPKTYRRDFLIGGLALSNIITAGLWRAHYLEQNSERIIPSIDGKLSEATVVAHSQIPNDWPTCAVSRSIRDGSLWISRQRNYSEEKLSQNKLEVSRFNNGTILPSTSEEAHKHINDSRKRRTELLATRDIRRGVGSGFLLRDHTGIFCVSNTHVFSGARRGLELTALQSAKEDLAAISLGRLKRRGNFTLPPIPEVTPHLLSEDLIGERVKMLMGGGKLPLEITAEVFQIDLFRGSDLLLSELVIWTPLSKVYHPKYIPGGSGSPVVLADDPSTVVGVTKSYRTDYGLNGENSKNPGLLILFVGPEDLRNLVSDWKSRAQEGMW